MDGDAEIGFASLVEPARRRVLELADHALAGLPPEDVPPSLQAVARFVPAKRRRLGAGPLAAALDTAAGFRETVAATLPEDASEDPSDDDLVAASVRAYLRRPEGWRDVVRDAGRRWEHERPDRGELDRLRDELAELRASARGEAARLRSAVEAAVADASRDAADELAALRRTVRDRTRELRAAERERDEARAETDRLRDAGARRDAALAADRDAELRRLRELAASAQRAADAGRRADRAERDVDDARLWLLVDTLLQAASGLRRELSLAPPTVRPADGVAAVAEADGARAVTDAGMLDSLLALPNVHLVVDGYNVTKTGYPDLTLADQRTRLTAALAPVVARCAAEVTVVFDGAARPPVQPPSPRGVRVLFSAADEIADDVIRRLVAAEPPGRPVVVVTSDRQVVHDTRRPGVWSAASSILLGLLA